MSDEIDYNRPSLRVFFASIYQNVFTYFQNIGVNPQNHTVDSRNYIVD